jgi:flavin-dependent dehydrogenase
LNYYFRGKTDLDPNTLYMFYQREYAPLMFAWVYLKDDLWVVGTGATENPKDYADRFYDYIKKRYNLRGKIVKREGFTSTLKEGVCLGEGNTLVTGDAAGLVDLYRGLGMDNAALSGRMAAKAIARAEKTGKPAIHAYERRAKRLVHRLEDNARKRERRYASDETLSKSMSRSSIMRNGLAMLAAGKLNALLPTERMMLLPR